MNERSPESMWRRQLFAAGTALATAVIVLAWVWHRQTFGPTIAGRSLKQWLALNLDDLPPGKARQLYKERIQAFRSAGETGVEFLLSASGEQHADTWRWWLFDLSKRISPRTESWVRERLVDCPKGGSLILHEVVVDSDAAARVLSRKLKEAEAGLLRANQPRWLSDESWSYLETLRKERFRALTWFIVPAAGADRGLDILTNSLAATKPFAVYEPLLSALEGMGTHAVRAVPAVTAMAENPEAYPYAASALIAIRGEARLPLEVIARAATNGQASAISTLAEYGPLVRNLLPQLLSLTTNSDPQVSFQAGIAVRKIRGETELPATP